MLAKIVGEKTSELVLPFCEFFVLTLQRLPLSIAHNGVLPVSRKVQNASKGCLMFF